MEFKWFMIFLATVAIGITIGTSVTAHYDNECKVAALQANKTANEIKELCK